MAVVASSLDYGKAKENTQMLLLAATLSVNMDLIGLLQKKNAQSAPSATCHIKVTSYKFNGKPGQRFTYDGDTYRIPQTGTIEIVANQRNSEYQINGKTLPLNVWAKDDFGTISVPMPDVQ